MPAPSLHVRCGDYRAVRDRAARGMRMCSRFTRE